MLANIIQSVVNTKSPSKIVVVSQLMKMLPGKTTNTVTLGLKTLRKYESPKEILKIQ